MKSYVCLLLVLLLLGAAALEAAETIKRGVSPASMAKLKQIADANSKKAAEERLKLFQQAAQATFDQLTTERDAFNAALSRQPEFNEMKREFDTFVALARDPNANKTKQQREQLRRRTMALAQKYEPVQSRAYAQAKINDNRVKSVIAAYFGQYLGKAKVTKRGLGWSVAQEAPAAEPSPPASTCIQPPYASSTASPVALLLGDATVSADHTTGEFSIEAHASFAGLGGGSADMHDFYAVPTGIHEMRVTVLIDATYALTAGAIVGASVSTANLSFSMSPLDGSDSLHESVEIAAVVAPIVWLAVDFGENEYKLSKTGYLEEGEYNLRAGGMTGGLAHPVGAGAAAFMSGKVKEICIEVLR